MDHPIIVNAFANAKTRVSSEKEEEAPIIYMSFKRTGVFYKDTYWILTGTWNQVDTAIQKAYKAISGEKQDEHFERGDHNTLLDTPFDTWCCGECKFLNCDDKTVCGLKTVCECECEEKTACDEKTKVKCGSHWVPTEHNSMDDLKAYIDSIHRRESYRNYCIEYM